MAKLSTRPNRFYPSIPSITDDTRTHNNALQVIKESVETHERRNQNYLKSFVRFEELVTLGIIDEEGNFVLETGGSTVSALNDLTDVEVPAPTDNDILAYDFATETWTAQNAAELGILGLTEDSSPTLTGDWDFLEPVESNGFDVFGYVPSTEGEIVPDPFESNIVVYLNYESEDISLGSDSFVPVDFIGSYTGTMRLFYGGSGGVQGGIVDIAKFGTRGQFNVSQAISGDLAAGYIASSNGGSEVNVQDGNFTFETFVRFRTAPHLTGDFQYLVGKWTSAGTRRGYLMGTMPSGAIRFVWSTTGGNSLSIETLDLTDWVADQWYHLAWVRNGSELFIFRDGVEMELKIGGDAIGTDAIHENDRFLHIAQPDGSGNDALDGYMDEFRFTKGIARYTADFTPPPVSFVDGELTQGTLVIPERLVLGQSDVDIELTGQTFYATATNNIFEGDVEILGTLTGTSTEGLQENFYARKTVNTSRASVTTVAADPELIVSVDSEGIYEIFAMLRWNAASATPDAKWGIFTNPVAEDANNSQFIVVDATNSTTEQYALQDIVVTPLPAGSNDWILVHGIVEIIGACDFELLWAQNASSADAVELREGSYMRVTRASEDRTLITESFL